MSEGGLWDNFAFTYSFTGIKFVFMNYFVEVLPAFLYFVAVSYFLW